MTSLWPARSLSRRPRRAHGGPGWATSRALFEGDAGGDVGEVVIRAKDGLGVHDVRDDKRHGVRQKWAKVA